MRELERAFDAFERVLVLDPENLQAALAAIAVLCESGRAQAALDRCRALRSRHAADAQLQFTTALVYEALNDFAAALEHYDCALTLQTDHPGALQNRGFALSQLGRTTEAIEANRRFVASRPRSVEAYYNLAESYLAARQFDDAVTAADNALKIDPGHMLSRLDRGLALAASGRIEEARADLQTVLAHDDPSVQAYVDKWFGDSGFVDRIETAALFQPEDAFLLMGCERLDRCDWTGLDAFVRRCTEIIRTAPPSCLRTAAPCFRLLHLPLPASLQRTVADRVAEAAMMRGKRVPRTGRTAREPAGILRIGYLSSDFGRHPVGFLTRSMYKLHDRRRFEVLGYSLAGNDGSENFHTISGSCDAFVDVYNLSAEHLATRIAEDQVDILVDLNGYTRNGRTDVLALRPAPIQVNYLGYPSTLGGTLADYFIGDAIASPYSLSLLFAEKIVHLPHSYIPASHRSFTVASTPTRDDAGLPERGFVFCAFHRHEKIDPVVFGAWMRILRAVPRSTLWLQQGSGEANLRRHARDAGVDASRLVFAPHRPHAEHLARQRLADLFLDTRVWNAHTTGADALWCGVPIVTCAGEHTVSRLGASLLHGIGLDELITESFEHYEALAIDLATHPEKLADLKARLEHNRETAPLFDVERLVRNLERAYLEMWRIHESGERPRSFLVEEPGTGRA
jgi:protein O-GlcNAc transferase